MKSKERGARGRENGPEEGREEGESSREGGIAGQGNTGLKKGEREERLKEEGEARRREREREEKKIENRKSKGKEGRDFELDEVPKKEEEK